MILDDESYRVLKMRGLQWSTKVILVAGGWLIRHSNLRRLQARDISFVTLGRTSLSSSETGMHV